MKSAIFRVSLAILLVSASVGYVSEVSADTDIEQLERNVLTKVVEVDEAWDAYQSAKMALEEAKLELERARESEKSPTERTDAEAEPEREKSQELKADNDDGDGPCPCLFDKDRVYVPEKLKYKDDWWECSEYQDDGLCAKVQIVGGGAKDE